jgi:hypothetical protein
MSSWWYGSSSSSSTQADEDLIGPDGNVKFPDFFPAVAKSCEKQSSTLFDCLSSKSDEYIRLKKDIELVKEGKPPSEGRTLPLPDLPDVETIAKSCLSELKAYNQCQLKHYQSNTKKSIDPATGKTVYFRPFRVQEEYRSKKESSSTSTSVTTTPPAVDSANKKA